MRIAVVQLEVRPEQRTIAFQRALRAVEVAADRDPAPDLILLPAFRDVAAYIAGGPAVGEKIPGQTTAAFGLKARQWGVFISLGLAEWTRNQPFVTSVLLDRDGDTLATHRQRRFETPAEPVFAAGDESTTANTILGRVALLTGDDVLEEAAWASAAKATAALVISSACRANREDAGSIDADEFRGRLCELAVRYDMPCAVADVVIPPNGVMSRWPGVSTIVSRQGVVLAAAEPDKEALLLQALELPSREGLEA